MNRSFLPSERVSYFPSTRFEEGRAVSVPSGRVFDVHAKRALVNAAFMNVSVPSTHPPRYAVDPDVTVVPPNALPGCRRPEDGYVVVGAGKTAFDAILWLLANFVEPEEITWIVPRDSWLINRAIVQPGPGSLRIGDQLAMIEAASSPADVFRRLEEARHLFRIDPEREPSMYRCATVSEAELADLRRIENVVRRGRVERVSRNELTLEGGVLERGADSLYVDCTADGLERRPVEPVFAEGKITLQTVRGCQQVFSAAFLGMVESLQETPVEMKNALAGVVPHPDGPRDFFSGALAQVKNMGLWSQNPDVMARLDAARLSPGSTADGDGPEPAVALRAAAKLQAFLAEWPE